MRQNVFLFQGRGCSMVGSEHVELRYSSSGETVVKPQRRSMEDSLELEILSVKCYLWESCLHGCTSLPGPCLREAHGIFSRLSPGYGESWEFDNSIGHPDPSLWPPHGHMVSHRRGRPPTCASGGLANYLSQHLICAIPMEWL